jgi:integrase
MLAENCSRHLGHERKLWQTSLWGLAIHVNGSMPKLTQELVESLPADGRDRIIFDAGTEGFGIRVTATGRKIFIAQARSAGKVRRTSVGTFPEMTVKRARQEALPVRAAMRRDEDPRAERAARIKAIEAGTVTVSAFADRWLAEYVRLKLKRRTIADYERLLEQKIKPALGHLLVTRVAKDDVLKFHSSLAATPRRANYAVSTFRAIMTFAEDCGLRPPASNPARRIKMYREKARERFLSEAEIGSAAEGIAAAEQAGKIGPHAAAALRLALFTGARRGELMAAEWSHLDWERRFIRLPDSKGNEPRTIYLSDAALQVLKGIPRIGKFIVAGAQPDEPYQNLSRAWMIAREFVGLDDVRLHDLRHSYASLAASKGVSLQMIGKLLGHRVSATTQRYAHLARDAVASVNDELGEAMASAIEAKEPREPRVGVLAFPRRKPAR